MLLAFIEFLFVFWREFPTGAIAGAIGSTVIVIVVAVSLSATDLGSALVRAFFGSLGGMPGSIIGQILAPKTLGPPIETAGAIVGGGDWRHCCIGDRCFTSIANNHDRMVYIDGR